MGVRQLYERPYEKEIKHLSFLTAVLEQGHECNACIKVVVLAGLAELTDPNSSRCCGISALQGALMKLFAASVLLQQQCNKYWLSST